MSDHLPPNDNPEQPKQVFVRSQFTAIYSLDEGTKNIYATSGTFRDAIEESRSVTYRALVKIYGKALLVRYGALQREEKRSLDGKSLMRLTDWVPSATARKRQKKLIADEIVKINEFRADGRVVLAKWRHLWLVIHWCRYLLGAPVAAILKLLRQKISVS